MRKLRIALITLGIVTVLSLQGETTYVEVASADSSRTAASSENMEQVLSPIWGASIRQWSAEIYTEATASGIDPDLVAAVINAESNGNQHGISRVGAVGLMGVMPTGPGLEWRPSAEALARPAVNLSWGVAILTEIIRQSGGDISAALAAYSGGWDYVNSQVPQDYARRVLNDYGRAVAARSNVSPEISLEWTIATEIKRGHVPIEQLILTDEPVSGLRTYGEHLVYHYRDEQGRAFYVKGYAVPLALVVPLEQDPANSGSDTVDEKLLARLGMADSKANDSNPRVILACLPSLARLRGHLSTRWYAPSSCPAWHR